MTAAYEQLTVQSRGQWRAWLESHHANVPGVWLATYKAGSGHPHVAYDDIAEEAIAFGWVDSRPRKLDQHRSELLITPRKPRANWSRANKERAERLITEGRMTPAGLAAVEAAKRNGAWTALDAVETLAEPADLRAALDATPSARQYWDTFPRSTRRAILEWITSAKTTATRDKRISQTAAQAARNIRANQWRQPSTRRPKADASSAGDDL